MSKIIIRPATQLDAEAILQIYAPYVMNTAITFEYQVPSVSEFQKRIEITLSKYPYLVAISGCSIVGYAYAGAFKTRAAYDWSVETTIYVKQDMKHQGIGKQLYAALEESLKLQGILNMNACIASPETEDERLTYDSIHFHECLGYTPVGKFHKCGYKFSHWYDMVWMEKHIGSHAVKPSAIKTFSEIKDSLSFS